MGNTAIVKPSDSDIGVYLHWNGGPDSITAFLKYCELQDYRPFGGLHSEGIVRFCQVVTNYLGGSVCLSTGVKETEEYADGLDNGIYVVEGWKVVKRIGHQSRREGYDLIDTLCEIDDAQPPQMRLTKGYIRAKEVNPTSLKVGDRVYYKKYDGEMTIKTVVGIGKKGQICNGYLVEGLPYMSIYGDNPSQNINNYIRYPIRKARRANT